MKHSSRKLRWVPDLPDGRDYPFKDQYSPFCIHHWVLPPSVSLRAGMSPVDNQGSIGSCTGNALAGAIEFLTLAKAEIFEASRLFIYYNERLIEGTVGEDSGALIRDGIKSLAMYGACSEDIWPYDVTQDEIKPSDTAYAEALRRKISRYERIDGSVADMKRCLRSGFPFVFGFTVFESFDSAEVAQTGVVPMPGLDENALGGHAVLCVGYDDATQRFLVRNSWGADWGAGGYFTIPYDYLGDSNLADDFWVIYA